MVPDEKILVVDNMKRRKGFIRSSEIFIFSFLLRKTKWLSFGLVLKLQYRHGTKNYDKHVEGPL